MTNEVKVDKVASSGGLVVVFDRRSVDIGRDARVVPAGQRPEGRARISVIHDATGPKQRGVPRICDHVWDERVGVS